MIESCNIFMLRRRSVLVSLIAAAAMAGCTDLQPGDDREDSDQQKNVSNSEKQNQTEGQDQVEEQDQTDKQRIGRIESELTTLEEALDMYVSFLENRYANILFVTSLAEEFDYLPIVNSIMGVSENLKREASLEPDDEVSAEILAVRQEAELIESIVRAQNKGQEAGQIAEEYEIRMEKSSYRLNSINADLVNQIEEFQSAIRTVESRLKNTSSPVLRERSRYENKLTQFGAELTNFEICADIHSTYSDAQSQLEDALFDFEDENYARAEEAAETAVEAFEIVSVELSETNDSLKPLINSFEKNVESQKQTASAVITVASELV